MDQSGYDAQAVPAGTTRLTALVRGSVQAVGFRWWVRARALELNLVGTVTNLDDGRVEVVAEGPTEACRRLALLLEEQPSTSARPGRVAGVSARWTPAWGGLDGFRTR